MLRNLQQSSGAMHPGLPDVPVQQEPWPCSTNMTHVVSVKSNTILAQLMCEGLARILIVLPNLWTGLSPGIATLSS